MSKKTNKIFLKKQIKKLKDKKKLNFKIEQNLEYIKIFNILNNYSILIFFQFISLNSEKEDKFYTILFDREVFYTYIKQKILNKIIDKKIVKYIKNFNNIIAVKNIEKLKSLNIILNEKKIMILGYYINNILFFKKDINWKNINKAEIYIRIIKLKKKIFNKKIN